VGGVTSTASPGRSGRRAAALRRLAPHAQPSEDRAPEWVAAGTPEPLRGQLTSLLGPERVLTQALI
jgi:hypothetical protein